MSYLRVWQPSAAQRNSPRALTRNWLEFWFIQITNWKYNCPNRFPSIPRLLTDYKTGITLKVIRRKDRFYSDRHGSVSHCLV